MLTTAMIEFSTRTESCRSGITLCPTDGFIFYFPGDIGFPSGFLHVLSAVILRVSLGDRSPEYIYLISLQRL
jgi:hypothetical protein